MKVGFEFQLHIYILPIRIFAGNFDTPGKLRELQQILTATFVG